MSVSSNLQLCRGKLAAAERAIAAARSEVRAACANGWESPAARTYRQWYADLARRAVQCEAELSGVERIVASICDYQPRSARQGEFLMSDQTGNQIAVFGGRPLAKVDEDEIRVAANRMGTASSELSRAGFLARDAAEDLYRLAREAAAELAWRPIPAALAADPTLARAEEAAVQQAREVIRVAERSGAEALAAAKTILATAAECETTKKKLLWAATSYVEHENRVQSTWHKLTRVPVSRFEQFSARWGLRLGVVSGLVLVPFALPKLAKSKCRGYDLDLGGYGSTGPFGALAPHPLPAPASRTDRLIQRFGTIAQLGVAFSPGMEEFIDNFGVGVALTDPTRAGRRFNPTGAAAILHDYAIADLNLERIYTHQYHPGLTPLDGVSVAKPAWANTPPRSIDDALSRVDQLHPYTSNLPGRTASGLPAGTIGVEKILKPDGTVSFNVYIPGTQGFEPGIHPHDGTTDLALMAGKWSDIEVAVSNSLQQAGAADGDPVVLIGHSLGGIAATKLASDPRFSQLYDVRGVVTAGSPTAYFETPAGVPALHLEHQQDVVPKTDGKEAGRNPQTPDRVTVVRDLAKSANPVDREASKTIAGTHQIDTYRRTLAEVLNSGNPQVADANKRIEEAMTGVSAATVFFVSRRLPDLCRPEDDDDETGG